MLEYTNIFNPSKDEFDPGQIKRQRYGIPRSQQFYKDAVKTLEDALKLSHDPDDSPIQKLSNIAAESPATLILTLNDTSPLMQALIRVINNYDGTWTQTDIESLKQHLKLLIETVEIAIQKNAALDEGKKKDFMYDFLCSSSRPFPAIEQITPRELIARAPSALANALTPIIEHYIKKHGIDRLKGIYGNPAGKCR